MLLRQQRTELRELGVQQSRGSATRIGEDSQQAFRADLTIIGSVAECQGHWLAGSGIESAGSLRECLCRDEQLGLPLRDLLPLETANRQAETVGGSESDLVTFGFHPDAGQHRQRLILAGSDSDLTNSLSQQSGIDSAGSSRSFW